MTADSSQDLLDLSGCSIFMLRIPLHPAMQDYPCSVVRDTMFLDRFRGLDWATGREIIGPLSAYQACWSWGEDIREAEAAAGH